MESFSSVELFRMSLIIHAFHLKLKGEKVKICQAEFDGVDTVTIIGLLLNNANGSSHVETTESAPVTMCGSPE